MINMRRAKQWGEEAKALVKERQESEHKRQRITFGKKSISVKKDEPIKMAAFIK